MRSAIFPALALLLLALAAPAHAQRMGDGETLDRILPEIRAAHPGRLSDAQPWIDENGRAHYRIKWMTPEGRILYFDADARTGRISNSGGDDGERWRRGRNFRSNEGGGDSRPIPDERGQQRDNWNDDSGAWPGSRDHNDGGDWRGGHDTGDNSGWHHREHGEH